MQERNVETAREPPEVVPIRLAFRGADRCVRSASRLRNALIRQVVREMLKMRRPPRLVRSWPAPRISALRSGE